MKIPPKRMTAAAGILAVALLVLFLMSRASTGVAREGSELEGTPDLLPAEKLKDVRPAATAVAAPSPNLDLLGIIQPSKDGVAGSWGFQDRALITSSVKWGRLQIPCTPPEEYDLKFALTRKRGTNSVNIGFVMGGKQGTIVLDGADGHTSWLDLPGVQPSENPTMTVGRLLKWNKPATVLLSVRKQSLTLAVDGKKIMEWKGNPGDLAVTPEFLVPNPRTLIIGSWETVYRIDEMALVPVTGTATLLR